MSKYVGVIVNSEALTLDKIFTYKVPENLEEKINIGRCVTVPFGKGNKKIYGFIVEIIDYIEDDEKIKEVLSIDDSIDVITLKNLELIKIMREKYLCTYLEGIKVMIPNGLLKGINFKTKKVISIGIPLEGKYKKTTYLDIIGFIKENNGKYTKTDLSKDFKLSLSSINTLIKHNFLKVEDNIINRYNDKIYENYEEKILTSHQQQAFDTIINSNDRNFLIHGITGSGKTEIYMALVKEMIARKKDSIILIPEISLTPQMVERFKGRFGRDVAIFHSKLSDGERFDEWMRVKLGKVKVAIGARSAIFLPFSNLGLIIIDEEHESSYKSDSDPKYNAREIAKFKSDIEGCKVVLGSATPSVETYYRGLRREYKIIILEKRVSGAELPQVEIVDMREELKNGNKSMFSRALYENIQQVLEEKNQILLFLNRRGFSTFVSCRECGYVFRCKNCDISLTYHNNQSSLTCHYCGAKESIPKICPKCGSKYVKYFGVGTEQLEEKVKNTFILSKTLRMDFDTTRGKDSYENIYKHFVKKKANVLIGTQMIAKGLDFPDVTLVGVIAADLSLNLPDYKASERTFGLITQVSGRAGRGAKRGKVVIQTYNPDNYSIVYAANNDYVGFYNEEIKIRELLNYPPFSEILCINLSSEDERNLIKHIQYLADKIKIIFNKSDKIEVLGPCPCGISKIKNYFRWQIIIKGNFTNEERKKIRDLTYENINYKNIRVSIDLNPNSLL